MQWDCFARAPELAKPPPVFLDIRAANIDNRFAVCPQRSISIQPRHGADGRARAALDLDREADEAEAALADELVEIAALSGKIIYLADIDNSY
jgi:hypothetical protein